VTSIIKAYQGKLEEVEGLNRVIKVLKTKNQGQNQEIRKLQHTITELRNQLASACEECKGKLPEKLRSLSLKETEVIIPIVSRLSRFSLMYHSE
jgi:predicted  nucleic acid-binding Zn-ribbon protein